MTKFFLIIAFSVVSAAAQTSIPNGATEIEPGVYRHTDKAGKTYIYRKTPFGVTKSADTASKAEDPAKPSDKSSENTPFGTSPARTGESLKVTDRGDMLEFERPSPFGVSRWKRKKDELTAAERSAWEQSRSSRGNSSADTAAGKK